MQAIQTKFIPCTNTRPSRIKAWAECGSITLSWDHALNVDENHTKVANALCEKLGWTLPHYGKLIGGSLPGGCYSFVFTPRKWKSHDATAQYIEHECVKVETSLLISVRFFGDEKETRQMNITKEQFDAIRELLTCEAN